MQRDAQRLRITAQLVDSQTGAHVWSMTIFRLDDTVRSAEILQGGPLVVFAGGQMGATANFLLKTGTDTPSGSLGMTCGDENLWRLDGFTGFPIGENWFGSVGGFWRTSDGVRDPALTRYNNAVSVCDGTVADIDYDDDFTSWTLGANYSFTDFMSAYARVNRGGHFHDFDNGIRGTTDGDFPPIQVIRNKVSNCSVSPSCVTC